MAEYTWTGDTKLFVPGEGTIPPHSTFEMRKESLKSSGVRYLLKEGTLKKGKPPVTEPEVTVPDTTPPLVTEPEVTVPDTTPPLVTEPGK